MLSSRGTLPFMAQALFSQVVHAALGAGQLLLRTEVVAVVVAACAAAWMLAGWVQLRAAVPGASHRWCLTAGSLLVAGAEWPRARRSLRQKRAALPVELVAASRGITLTLLWPAALGALVYVAVDSGLPVRVPAPVLWVTGIAAIGGLALSVRAVTLVPGRKLWQAARGGHVTSAVIVGEIVLATTAICAAWAFTAGSTTVTGLLEVGLVSIVARLVTLTRLPRAGFVVADTVFVAMLIALGTATSAALATVAVWRAGLGLAWLVGCAGRLMGGSPQAEVRLPAEPTGSALGEWIHRGLFKLIAALPPRLAARVRVRVFGTMFSLSDDPWRYDELPYERRKQAALVDALPVEALAVGAIVEVGCADGHNLAAFAERHPAAQVIGLDISPVAVTAASARFGGEQQVTVAVSDARGAASALAAMGVEAIGVLVLSEMLYYVGGPAQIRAEFHGLAQLVRPGSAVVLVHGGADAARLHPAAIRALGLTTSEKLVFDDPSRPFVIETAR